MSGSAVAVIPARWASTRFPGKILAPLSGKPLIQHVWERVKRVAGLTAVLVACDDDHVRQVVESFGAETVMTDPRCPSGTDRVAQAVNGRPEEIVVNVQADEPLIRPETIASLIEGLNQDRARRFVVATPVKAIEDLGLVEDPHTVKVVRAHDGRALYFSRSPIPFVRDKDKGEVSVTYWKHIGVYAYRKRFLVQCVQWPPSDLEKAERLEQLRILQADEAVLTVETPYDSLGVDVPEDIPRIEKYLREERIAS